MTECPHETLELSLGLTGVFCPECDRIWTVDFTRIRAGLEAALAVMPKPGGDEWEAKPVSGPAWEKGEPSAIRDLVDGLSAEIARLGAEIKRRDDIAEHEQDQIDDAEISPEEILAESFSLRVIRLAEAEAEKEAAVKAEREACVGLAESEEEPAPGEIPFAVIMVLGGDMAATERAIIGAVRTTKRNIAAAIRARGEGET